MLYALYYQLGAKSLTSHLKIKTEKRKARSCRDQKNPTVSCLFCENLSRMKGV